MTKLLRVAAACGLVLAAATVGMAAEISGDYLEARTCDVYTGPCFANAEIGMTGKHALMAWSVEKGSWNGVDLSGLSVAAAIRASDTLAMGGPYFKVNPYPIKSVLFVDEKATSAQREALIAFAKAQAGRVLEKVVRVEDAPIELSIDHLESRGRLVVGNVAKIETRAITKADCTCSNEEIFYPPLADVENYTPAVTVSHEYTGGGLDSKWKSPGKRSAFVATFSR